MTDKKVRTVIVDDEKENIDLLKYFLDKYCHDKIEIVGEALSKKGGIETINHLRPELLILDIQLDDGNAFELIENLTLERFKTIFVTAFDEFALKAFKYNVVDYILKPVQIDELVNAIDKVCDDLKDGVYTNSDHLDLLSKSIFSKSNLDFIVVPSMDKKKFVKLDDILYLKSDGGYTTFFLVHGSKIVSSKNIGLYEETIQEASFYRSHNSYIVNLKHVRNIDKAKGNYFEMSNGEFIPISKRKESQLKKHLNF